jgi:cyclopropane fatty-acyl-phospholipid synthase-like methyltransferase
VNSTRDNWEAYLLSEWERYEANPERSRATLTAVARRAVSRVLDVGCGAGQELLPFVRELGAKSTGVDVSTEAIQLACRQFATLGLTIRGELLNSDSNPGTPSFIIEKCL